MIREVMPLSCGREMEKYLHHEFFSLGISIVGVSYNISFFWHVHVVHTIRSLVSPHVYVFGEPFEIISGDPEDRTWRFWISVFISLDHK